MKLFFETYMYKCFINETPGLNNNAFWVISAKGYSHVTNTLFSN